jgi:tetratricopeptide (TPR) repeat protein
MAILEEKSALRQQITNLEKTLRILELQRDQFTDSYVPPHIIHQINEIKDRIDALAGLLTLLEDEFIERSEIGALGPGDWRELFSDQKFVNRTKELAILNQHLSSISGISVISIVGQGGSGKSFLLKHFGNQCTTQGVPWVMLDEGIISSGKIYILQSMRIQLGKNIDDKLFSDFDQAFLRSNKYLEELKIAQENANQVLPEVKLDLLKKIDKILVVAFKNACFKIKRKITLIIDTYEKVSNETDEWVCSVLLGCLPESSLCIIAGRTELKNYWDNNWKVSHIQLLSFSSDAIDEFLNSKGLINSEISKQIYELTGGLPLFLAMVPADTTLTSMRNFDLQAYVKSLLRNLPKNVEDALATCAIFRRFDEQILKHFNLSISYGEIRNFGFVSKNSNGLAIHDEIRKYFLDDLLERNPEEFLRLNREAAKYYATIRELTSGFGKQMSIAEELYHSLIVDPVEALELFKLQFEIAKEKYDINFCEVLIETIRSVNINDPDLQLWRDYYIGEYHLIKREWTKSKEMFEQVSKSFSSSKLESLTYRSLGNCFFELYRLEDAISNYLKAIELFVQLDDMEKLASVYGELGEAYRQNRELDRSMDATEKSVQLWKEINNDFEEGRSLSLLANSQRTKGSEDKLFLDKSIQTYHAAIKVQSRIDDKIGLALTLRELGSAYFRKELLTDAEQNYERSVRIEQSIKNDYGLSFALNGIAKVYAQRKKMLEAIEAIQKALAIQQKLGHRFGIANTLHNLGRLYIENRNYIRAIETLTESRKAWIELGNNFKANYVLTNLAKAELLMGNITTAANYFRDSLSYMQEKKMEVHVAENYLGLAFVNYKTKEFDEAEKCIRSAQAIFEERQPKRYKETFLLLSKIKLAQGNTSEAKDLMDGLENQNIELDELLTDFYLA